MMSYGFEIRNELGIPIIEYDKCLYIKSDGQTSTFNSSLSPTVPADFNSLGFEMVSKNPGDTWAFFGHGLTLPPISSPGVPGYVGAFYYPGTPNFYALPAYPSYGWAAGRQFIMPIPTQMSQYDTVFYKIGTVGLRRNVEIAITNLPGIPDGLVTAYLPGANISMPVRVCTPDLPALLPGSVGMRILNETGEVTFDSRAPFMSISAAYLIRKSTLLNILQNNVVEDITLPQAMPNCWVSLPFFHVYLKVFAQDLGGGFLRYDYYFVKITQVNATTIRLSRDGPNRVQTPPSQAIDLTYTHDLIMYVARDT